jgi:hypothetical protein
MSNLGGGLHGISPQLINTNVGGVGGSYNSRRRHILVQAWNGAAATGTINGYKRAIGPFRAVNNAGDFLSRQNYTSGGSNQVNSVRGGLTGYKVLGGAIQAQRDNTGIPSATCNPRFVYDGSDYVRFKKLQAINRNYNDYSFGGDQSNASQSPWRRTHHF